MAFGLGEGTLANQFADPMGLFGKKKKPPIDISGQMNQVKNSTAMGRQRVDALYDALQPKTQQFQADANAAIAGSRADAAAQKGEFLKANEDLTNQSKDLLRANLYSKEFTALPDTLRAVREASAAGGGLDTGSYQQSVGDVGRDTMRNIVSGERDIQIQGLEGQQNAQQVAYQTFQNLSSKLDDQQLNVLTKVLDTGREDLVRQTTQQLGLDESETQAIVDLLNFQTSGQLAMRTADDANKQALLSGLLQTGGTIVGGYFGGPGGAAAGNQVGKTAADNANSK